ncbi:MAG: tRNA (adenosine(37)-N6)-threonylcarbamoyltransferase complex dimerization subunit type 1 TsaB [Lachnospiraceae bacterium]|nr:tRNA (adenosine(37)-N6)-threonylcarbamoyltransferase complex dimerization subunit type 1 TsaB [Lachnospiraceae bacterium]
MNILAIESSGTVAGVAVMEGDKLKASSYIDTKLTHSTTLMPLVDKTLNAAGMDVAEIGLIGVSKGPGSFTGLRIGAGTAKGLAIALNCDIAPVSTLQVLAQELSYFDGIICPIMNARRNQVYTCIYRWDFENDCLKPLSDEMAVDINDLFKELEKYSEKIIFTGDGVDVFYDTLQNDFKNNYKKEFIINHKEKRNQNPVNVAIISKRMFEENKCIKVQEFKPEYLRKSQAEREREAALKEESKEEN